jgi:beta-RFAP synthase
MASGDPNAVFVEADARLHFGVLDLRGSLGRWFGGIGAAVSAPSVLVSAAPAEALEVTGEDAPRAAEYARRFLAYHRVSRGVRLHVHRALPPHSGLGSGTQLALSVGRAIGAVLGITTEVRALARAVGRASRSAIGTWTFARGGFVLEGGRRQGDAEIAPLIARLSLPDSWRCVLVVPAAKAGLNGPAEDAAFAELPPPSEHDVGRVAHLVLMGLLPAIVDSDLAGFGTALTEIQRVTGRWFASVQGGMFSRGPSEEAVRQMIQWGVPGVGQSSWGPAVYGIVDGEEAARVLADRLRGVAPADTPIHVGSFASTGARVWAAGESGASSHSS